MTDTPAHVERLFRRQLMARSGAERFLMGLRMFEAAREMALASFPPGASLGEQRRLLLARFYGLNHDDLSGANPTQQQLPSTPAK